MQSHKQDEQGFYWRYQEGGVFTAYIDWGERRGLINIPGVYYPPHMLTEKTQRERHLPVVLSKPPAWAISSRQAAEILGCKQSSTRELLHRERVRFCRVAEKGCPPMAYWDRRRVQALARKLRTPLTHVSPQLIASAEALAILRVSRNSLSRFVKHGLLQRFRLRVCATAGWIKARIVYNIFTGIISAQPLACAGGRVTFF